MRVGIVTTWNERCGIAATSESLVRSLPDVEWRIIGREEWGDSFTNVPNIAKTCDVTHIMHHGGLTASMSPETVRACGKTVITRHCVGSEAVFDAATIKTCHEKKKGYRWIPLGIRVIDALKNTPLNGDYAIGCCGIPFGGKGHMEAYEIARRARVGLRLVIPENPHTSIEMAPHIERLMAEESLTCRIETRWLPEEAVSYFLSSCLVNVFYYTRQANGISGAVRMGLAAGKPVIVSKHSQFKDIINAGGVTVATSIEEAAQLVRGHARADLDLVSPRRLLEEFDYRVTARMYYALYQEALSA